MDLIIAILLYLGVIASPEQATQTVIDQNRAAIENVKETDDAFMNAYRDQNSDDANGTTDDGIVIGLSDEE